MPRPDDDSRRSPILKELLYLIVCGLVALVLFLAWKHFHHDEAYSKDPEAQEKAEKLYDH
jgi:hypothetical protein